MSVWTNWFDRQPMGAASTRQNPSSVRDARRLRSHGRRSHKQRIKRRRRLFEQLEDRRVLANVAWDGGGDGTSWSDPLNWDSDVVPTIADDVTLDVVGDPVIEIDTTNGAVNRVDSQEILRLAGNLRIANASELAGGIRGDFGTLTVESDLTFSADSYVGNLANVDGGGRILVRPAVHLSLGRNTLDVSLENQGNVLIFQDGGSTIDIVTMNHDLVNRPGAEIRVQDNTRLAMAEGARLVNEGSVRNVNGGIAELSGLVINRGELDPGTGELLFRGPVENEVDLSIASGQTLSFENDFDAGVDTVIDGDGTFHFEGSIGHTINFSDAQFLPTGQVDFFGFLSDVMIDNTLPEAARFGTIRSNLQLGADQVFHGTSGFQSGTLTGSGDLTLSGDWTTNRYTFAGTGKLGIAQGSRLRTFNTANNFNRDVDVFGELTHQAGQAGIAGAFHIHPTGVFQLVGDADLSTRSSTLIHNEGIVRKTGGGESVTTHLGSFLSTGSLLVPDGRLELQMNNQILGPSSVTGILELGGVTQTSLATSFTGTGTLVTRGTVDLNDATIDVSVLELRGATTIGTSLPPTIQLVSGNAAVTWNQDQHLVSPSLSVTQFIGPASLTFSGNIGTNDITIDLDGSLEIGAGSSWSAFGNLTLGQASTNHGELRLRGDGGFAGNLMLQDTLTNAPDGIMRFENEIVVRFAGSQLVNEGRLEKTSAKRTQVVVDVVNRGVIEVDEGRLELNLGLETDGGRYHVSSGAELNADLELDSASRLSGSGMVIGDVTNGGLVAPGETGVADIGELTISGRYTQTAGGTLEIGAGSATANEFDLLTITGNAALDGTVSMQFQSATEPNAGESFRPIAFASVSGDFSRAVADGLQSGLGIEITQEPNATRVDVIPSSTNVEALRGHLALAREDVQASLPVLAEQYSLNDSSSEVPILHENLSHLFALPSVLTDLGLPAIPDAADYETFLSQLQQSGFEVLCANDASGFSSCGEGENILQLRLPIQVANLQGESTFDNDSVSDMSDLVEGIEFDGSLRLTADLGIDIVIGVNESGFRIDPNSRAELVIRGAGDLEAGFELTEDLAIEMQGTADLGNDGLTVSLSASSASDFPSLAAFSADVNESIQGGAEIRLSQSIDALGLQWGGIWSFSTVDNVTSSVAAVDFPSPDQFTQSLLRQATAQWREVADLGIVELFESTRLPFTSSTNFSSGGQGNTITRAEEEENYFERQFLYLIDALAPALNFDPEVGLPGTGVVYTEGDRLIGADQLRRLEGLSGEGIKIGLISDGVLGRELVSDDALLPDITPGKVHEHPVFSGGKIIGLEKSGAEGTAMIEIIHDIAPQAEIFFVGVGDLPGRSVDGAEAFIEGMAWFIEEDVDIVVDDIGLVEQSFFSDDTVAQAIDAAIENANILYVSAAGNDADDHYQGLLQPITVPGVLNSTSELQQFSVGQQSHRYPVSIEPGESLSAFLQWSSPDFGAGPLPYDLVLVLVDENDDPIVHKNGSVVFDSGRELTPEKSEPRRSIGFKNQTDDVIQGALVVGILDRPADGERTGRKQLPSIEIFVPASESRLITPNDSVYGHPALENVLTVGAVDVNEPGSDTPRVFSSYGPVTLWDSAANALIERTGIVDVIAPDGASVSGVKGFGSTFPGTSAAAPHVAGLAALLLQHARNLGSLTLDQSVLYDAIVGSAIDIRLDPIAVPDTFEVNMLSESLLISGADLVANDIDPNRIVLSDNDPTPPAMRFGGLVDGGGEVQSRLVTDNGAIVRVSRDEIVYEPNQSFTGLDQFNYQVIGPDGRLGIGSVLVAVQPALIVAGPTLVAATPGTDTPVDILTISEIGEEDSSIIHFDRVSKFGASIELGEDSDFVYRFEGPSQSLFDQFEYRVTKGGVETVGVADIAIHPDSLELSQSYYSDDSVVIESSRTEAFRVSPLANDLLAGGESIFFVDFFQAGFPFDIELLDSDEFSITPNEPEPGRYSFEYDVLRAGQADSTQMIHLYVHERPISIAREDYVVMLNEPGNVVSIPVLENDVLQAEEGFPHLRSVRFASDFSHLNNLLSHSSSEIRIELTEELEILDAAEFDLEFPDYHVINIDYSVNLSELRQAGGNLFVLIPREHSVRPADLLELDDERIAQGYDERSGYGLVNGPAALIRLNDLLGPIPGPTDLIPPEGLLAGEQVAMALAQSPPVSLQDVLAARGFALNQSISGEQVRSLLTGDLAGLSTLAEVQLQVTPEFFGSSDVEFDFSLAQIGALQELGLAGDLGVNLSPQFDLEIGFDLQGFYIGSGSRLDTHLSGSAELTGSVAGLTASANASLAASPQLSLLPADANSDGRIRLEELAAGISNLSVDLQDVQATLEVSLASDLLDYVDVDGDVENNSPRGGDAFQFRASTQLTGTIDGESGLEFQWGEISIGNPDVDGDQQEDFTSEVLVENARLLAQDVIRGNRTELLGGLSGGLGDLDLFATNGSFADGTDLFTSLADDLLDQTEVVTVIDFDTIESWLNGPRGDGIEELIRLKVNLDDIPLELNPSVQVDVASMLPGISVENAEAGLRNALLKGQLVFGLDTADDPFYLMVSGDEVSPDASELSISVDLFAQADRLTIGDNLLVITEPTAMVRPGVEFAFGSGGNAKMRFSDLDAGNIAIDASVLPTDETLLYSESARFFPGSETEDFGADAHLVGGRVDVSSGKVSLTATRVGLRVGKALQAVANGVDIEFDPSEHAPDAVLAQIDSANVFFPEYPLLPGIRVDGLTIRRNGFAIDSFTTQVAGSPVEPEILAAFSQAAEGEQNLTLGGTVWLDGNGDHFSNAEPGLAGVTVRLYDANDTGMAISETTTDASGDYQFAVSTGMYVVEFVLPMESMEFVTPNVGGESQDSDVNANGRTGTLEMVANDEFNEADAGLRNVIRRPVLLVPGIVGTMPKNIFGSYRDWLMQRGRHPDTIEADPLTRVYDDLIQSLQNVGYTLNKDLFVVTYDWRVLPGPEPETEEKIDGKIEGLDAQSLVDTRFDYGADYLGFFLDRAATEWAKTHGNAELDSVDVIAHSTGGLVTRAYIQSDAYHESYTFGKDEADQPLTRQLPRVNHFISMGVPHRGAAKAWNVLHNNVISDSTFKFVVSKIIYSALKKLQSSESGVILGPSGDPSGPDAIRLLDLEAMDGDLETNFLRKYVPTAQSLLATFPFLRDADGDFVDLNSDPQFADIRNTLALDLNAGMDHVQVGDPNAFVDRLAGKLHVIGGVSESTLLESNTMIAETFADGAGNPNPRVIARMSDYIVNSQPDSGADWFQDVEFAASGDGTVPFVSSIEQFKNDSKRLNEDIFLTELSTHPTEDAPGHLPLMYLPRSQNAVMNGLQVLAPQGAISQGLAVSELELGLSAGVLGSTVLAPALSPTLIAGKIAAGGVQGFLELQNIVSVIVDPVGAVLLDGNGNQVVGFDAATGSPIAADGAAFIGGADGFGLVYGDFEGPFEVVVTGIDGDYFLQGDFGGARVGGFSQEGILADGERLSIDVPTTDVSLRFGIPQFLEVEGLVMSGSDIDVTFSESGVDVSGEITIAAQAAVLFPDSTTDALDGVVNVTGTDGRPGFQGTIDLRSGTLALSAQNAVLEIEGVVTASASGDDNQPGLSLLLDPFNRDPSTPIATINQPSIRFPSIDAVGSDFVSLDSISLRRNGLDLVAQFGGPDFSASIGDAPEQLSMDGLTIQTDLHIDLTETKNEFIPRFLVTGSVSLTADGATLLPNSPLTISVSDDDATDGFSAVQAALDLESGSLSVELRQIAGSISGVIDFAIHPEGDQSALQFDFDPAAEPLDDLLQFGSLSASIPALAFEGKTPGAIVNGLAIRNDGVARVSDVTIHLPDGYLGNTAVTQLLPVEFQSIRLGFDDPNDLNSLTVGLTGDFHLTGLQDSLRGILGPEVTISAQVGNSSSNLDFELAIESLSAGKITPLNFGPIEIGLGGLSAGGKTLSGQLTLGGLVDGVVQNDLSGFFEFVSNDPNDLFAGLRIDVLPGSSFLTTDDTASLDIDAQITFDAAFEGTLAGVDVAGKTVDLRFLLEASIIETAPFIEVTHASIEFVSLTIDEIDITIDGFVHIFSTELSVFNPGQADGQLADVGNVTVDFIGAFDNLGTGTIDGLRLFEDRIEFDNASLAVPGTIGDGSVFSFPELTLLTSDFVFDLETGEIAAGSIGFQAAELTLLGEAIVANPRLEIDTATDLEAAGGGFEFSGSSLHAELDDLVSVRTGALTITVSETSDVVAEIVSATVAIPRIKDKDDAPLTFDVAGTVAEPGLVIRKDGFDVKSTTVTGLDFSIEQIIDLRSVSIAVSDVSYRVDGGFTGQSSVRVTADEVSLIAGGDLVNGSVTGFALDARLDTGSFSVSADDVDLQYGSVGFENVGLDGNVSETGQLAIDLSGDLVLDDIRVGTGAEEGPLRIGFSASVNAQQFSLGGDIDLRNEVVGIGPASDRLLSLTGFSASTQITVPLDQSRVSGHLTVQADSAQVSPGIGIAAEVTGTSSQPGLSGMIDFATGRIDLELQNFQANFADVVTLASFPVGSAPAIAFTFDPAASPSEPLVSFSSVTARLPAISPSVSGTFTDFGFRHDGSTFLGGASFSGIGDALKDLGVPAFITIDELGLESLSGGSLTSDEIVSLQFRLLASGGVDLNEFGIPLEAEVRDLRITAAGLDGGNLLSSIQFGSIAVDINPPIDVGPLKLGGGFTLESFDPTDDGIDNADSLLLRVAADVSFSGIQLSGQFLVTEYGPIAMGLGFANETGVPLGPVTLFGADAYVAFNEPIPDLPERCGVNDSDQEVCFPDPIALIKPREGEENEFDLSRFAKPKSDLIRDAESNARQFVRDNRQREAMGQEPISILETPVLIVLSGQFGPTGTTRTTAPILVDATVGANFSLTSGSEELLLFGLGTANVGGAASAQPDRIGLGTIGAVLSLGTGQSPEFQIAFASPSPGSDLGNKVPATVELAASFDQTPSGAVRLLIDGTVDVLDVLKAEANGIFLLDSDGIYGDLKVDVSAATGNSKIDFESFGVGDLKLNAAFSLLFNFTDSEKTFGKPITVDGQTEIQTVSVAASTTRIYAAGVLQAGGFEVEGAFLLQDDSSELIVAASGAIRLGDFGSVAAEGGVRIKKRSANPEPGAAGHFAITAQLGIPGIISIDGGAAFQFNTLPNVEQIEIPRPSGQTELVELDEGEYFRVLIAGRDLSDPDSTAELSVFPADGKIDFGADRVIGLDVEGRFELTVQTSAATGEQTLELDFEASLDVIAFDTAVLGARANANLFLSRNIVYGSFDGAILFGDTELFSLDAQLDRFGCIHTNLPDPLRHIGSAEACVPRVVIPNQSIREGADNQRVRVELTRPLNETVVVTLDDQVFEVDGDDSFSAINPRDYRLRTTAITIPAGETVGRARIDATDNDDFEERIFRLIATRATRGGGRGDVTIANVENEITIANNDVIEIGPPVELTVLEIGGDARGIPESSGEVIIPIAVLGLQRLDSVRVRAEVQRVQGSSGSLADDFGGREVTSTVAVFEKLIGGSERDSEIRLVVLDDDIPEFDEEFAVRLSVVDPARFAPSTTLSTNEVRVKIRNDDPERDDRAIVFYDFNGESTIIFGGPTLGEATGIDFEFTDQVQFSASTVTASITASPIQVFGSTVSEAGGIPTLDRVLLDPETPAVGDAGWTEASDSLPLLQNGNGTQGLNHWSQTSGQWVADAQVLGDPRRSDPGFLAVSQDSLGQQAKISRLEQLVDLRSLSQRIESGNDVFQVSADIRGGGQSRARVEVEFLDRRRTSLGFVRSDEISGAGIQNVLFGERIPDEASFANVSLVVLSLGADPFGPTKFSEVRFDLTQPAYYDFSLSMSDLSSDEPETQADFDRLSGIYLTAIDFWTRSDFGGPTAWQLRSSEDGFQSALASGIVVNHETDLRHQVRVPLDDPFLVRPTLEPIEFRLYGIGAENADAVWVVDNLQLIGDLDRLSGLPLPPVAVDDVILVPQQDADQGITLNYRANDFDPNGDSIRLVSAGGAKHGKLTIVNQSIRYQRTDPDASFDTFTYTIAQFDDPTKTATASVQVKFAEAPTLRDDRYLVTVGETLVVNADEGVLANDSFGDFPKARLELISEPFRFVELFSFDTSDGSFSIRSTDDAPAGTEVNFDYQLVADNPIPGGEPVIPNAGRVTVRFDNADSRQAIDDRFTGAEDKTISGNVLLNDAQGFGETLVATRVTPPQSGPSSIFSLKENGDFSYRAPENFNGSTSFVYTIGGEKPDNIFQATVTIDVDPVNDRPVASGQTIKIGGTSVSAVSITVSGSDVETPLSDLQAFVSAKPTFGTITKTSARSFSYLPPTRGLGGKTDSFTFYLRDKGDGDSKSLTSSPARISIQSTAVTNVVSKSGKGRNAHIESGTVWLEHNGSSERDETTIGGATLPEPSTQTLADGSFLLEIPDVLDVDGSGSIDGDEGRLYLSGGTVTATGLPLRFPLKAHGDAGVVNPLTTLLVTLTDDLGLPRNEAEAVMSESLGITAYRVTEVDPLQRTLDGDPQLVWHYLRSVQLIDTVTMLVGFFELQPGVTTSVLADFAYLAIGQEMVSSREMLDLSDVKQASRLVETVASLARVEVPTQDADVVGEVIAASNSEIDALSPVAEADLIRQIARVEQVASDRSYHDLQRFASGDIDADTLLQRNLGETLREAIASAVVGNVVIPQLSAHDAVVSLDVSDPSLFFEVTLDRPSLTPVTVTYQSLDGTLISSVGDYTPVSGELLFTPGESTQTIEVPVSSAVGSLRLMLEHSSGAMVTNALALGIVLPAGGDSDAVDNLIENGGPNGGDSNLDSVLDMTQNHVAGFADPNNAAYVTAVASEGVFIRAGVAEFATAGELGISSDGLVVMGSIDLTLLTSRESEQIELIFERPLVSNASFWSHEDRDYVPSPFNGRSGVQWIDESGDGLAERAIIHLPQEFALELDDGTYQFSFSIVPVFQEALPSVVVTVEGTDSFDLLRVWHNHRTDEIFLDTLSDRTVLGKVDEIDRIEINGNGGSDWIHVERAFPLPVRIDGGEGNDLILGTLGDDEIWGGPGRDKIVSYHGDDTVFGGDGNDLILTGPGDDFVLAGNGNDFVNSGLGDDTVDGGSGRDVIYANAGDDVVDGGDSADRIFGGPGDDLLFGGRGSDSITGNLGDDLIRGGRGNDELRGVQGNDNLRGGRGHDRLIGGDGDDWLHGDQGDDQIFGQLGDDTLLGGNGNDFVKGGFGDDLLFGDGGNDRILGNAGDDRLFGGGGTDDLDGGAGINVIESISKGNLPEGQSNAESESARSSGLTENLLWSRDVNGDGHITALDALLVINRLSTTESSEFAITFASDTAFDSNNDDKVSALDALVVLNYLSQNSNLNDQMPAADRLAVIGDEEQTTEVETIAESIDDLVGRLASSLVLENDLVAKKNSVSNGVQTLDRLLTAESWSES